MEQDRYSVNNKLYIVGIISLLLALSLFIFSLYILPYLIWNLYYDVPGFLIHMIEYFQREYNYSAGGSKMLTWLIFFIPALVAGYISYYISNYIDAQVLGLNTQIDVDESQETASERQKDRSESLNLSLKIISLMILIVVIILILELFVKSTAITVRSL